MDEKKTYSRNYTEDKSSQLNRIHKVNMTSRKSLMLTGIKDVISFDANEVLLESTLGVLMIRGDELHITRINLDKGETDIEGHIDGMIYPENAGGKKAESIIGRLFR